MSGWSDYVLTIYTFVVVSQGVTNKKEWDSFVRSKERFKVHEFFASNRVELFNMWLDQGKNWDATVLAVKRKHLTKNQAIQGMTAVQGKDIKKQYTPDKATAIIQSRKTSGMWYPCQDFPDDEDETQLCFNNICFV